MPRPTLASSRRTVGLERALAHAARRRSDHLRDLARLVSFRTVSADPAAAGSLHDCARWLARRLAHAGMEAGVVPTGGHPFVVARWTRRAGAPTLLVYGHYDVQPADPRDGWTSTPFRPVRRGEYLVGRGASDDKGPVVAHIAALEAWLEATGALPVNVVALLDGEEEIGSPSLRRWLRATPPPVAADAVVVSDAAMPTAGRPALVRSLRGMVALNVALRARRPELHSGAAGGVRNPVEELCRVVAGLRDGEGRIAVPGFYRRARSTAGPSLVVTGVAGGYTGPGAKSVVPASATAALEIRLVESQRPDEVAVSFERHLRGAVPPEFDVSVRVLKASRPVRLPLEDEPSRAAARALRTAFGVAPAVVASGGSLHVVPALLDAVGAPVVVMGFALPGDGRHGPDERFHLPAFARATDACIAFLHELSRTRVPW